MTQTDLFNTKEYVCPTCGLKQKLYKKPLIGTAVYELILLYLIWKRDRRPVHISNFSKQRSNFYTLKYWGMIRGSDKVEGKRTAGLWEPTSIGIDFIRCNVGVYSHAETMNNKLVRFSGDIINVREALKKKFDYDELMGLK